MNDAIIADAREVVRAVPSDRILANIGNIFKVTDLVTPRIFEQIAEEDRAYNFSKPANSIDYFISHSWRTSGLEKGNAIAVFLHVRFAVLVALTTLGIVSAVIGHRFRLSDTLCQSKTSIDWLNDCLWAGSIPVLTGLVTMLFVRFGQHLLSTSVDCFLDKACIHQGNLALKQPALQCLDIMLLYSRRMLVLWAPDYFDRLWCIYELATFMKLHPDAASRVDFIPTWMTTFVSVTFTVMVFSMPLIGLMSTGPLLRLGMEVAGPYWGYALVHNLVCLVPITMMGLACYQKVSQHMLMMRQMRNFKLDQAMCQDLSDKVFILNVIDLMWSSSRESHDGKDNFERYVREKLPVQLEAAIGMRSIVPYRIVMIAYLPLVCGHSMFGVLCDQHMVAGWGYSSAYMSPHSRSFAFFSGWMLYCLLNCCFCNPTSSTLAQLVCACTMDRKWRPWVCAALTIVTYGISLNFFIDVIVAFVMLEPSGANWRMRWIGLSVIMGAMTCACWNLPKRLVQ